MLHIAIHIFLYNTSTVYSSEKLLALSRPQSVKVNIKKAGVLVYLFFNSQHMRQAVNKKQNFNSSFMPNPCTHITEHPHFRTTWYTGEFTKTLKNGNDSSAAAIPYCTGFQSSASLGDSCLLLPLWSCSALHTSLSYHSCSCSYPGHATKTAKKTQTYPLKRG